MRSYASVSFANHSRSKKQKQPVDVRIYQREYFHDVAVVEIYNEPSINAKYRSGMPVTVAWGWAPKDTEHFYGFVHHTEQKEHPDKAGTLLVYCIGVSWQMKSPSTRVWRKERVRNVVSRIAKHYKLSATIEDDKVSIDQLTQHGQSDWDFLVHLAQRRGFTFFVNKTDVRFHLRRPDLKPEHATYFRKHPQGHHYEQNSVYSFKHEVGETLPKTHRKTRKVHGVTDAGKHVTYIVDPDTCDVLGTVTPPVLFGEMVNARPVHSTAEAKNYLADMNDKFRFHYKATAVISGAPKVKQADTIRLHGIDKLNDGYWYVTEVCHHVTLDGYQLEIELGRDSMGNSVPTTATPVSVTGKPVVYDGCGDASVTDPAQEPPDTIYNAPEDCWPVDGSGVDDSLNDNGVDQDDPTRVPLIPNQHCSCCKGKLIIPHRPHLGVWRAKHVTVRKPPKKVTRLPDPLEVFGVK